MDKKMLKNSLWKSIYVGIGLIVLLIIVGGYEAQAQQPFWVPWSLPSSAYYHTQKGLGPFAGTSLWSGVPIFPPTIRQYPSTDGWHQTSWSTGNFQLAMSAPRPVIRRAAATLTLLITQGPTSALLVYNPTILFGPTAAATAVIPTALTLPSLLGGKPLIFSTAPITSSNLAILNYVANTFLLPSGISFYIIP